MPAWICFLPGFADNDESGFGTALVFSFSRVVIMHGVSLWNYDASFAK